jgi:hypothetical protein
VANVTTEGMALAISIKGEIIESNFEDFRALAIRQIEGVKFDLTTDADFIEAKENVKRLDGFEKKLAASETDILKQMDGINALITGCREIKVMSRDKRLVLSKTIKDQTDLIKKGIEDDAVASIEGGDREIYRLKIALAMKGKRNLETIESAAIAAAQSINEHNVEADLIIAEFVERHGATIAPDKRALREMQLNFLRDQLTRRAELSEQAAESKRLAEDRNQAEAELAKLKSEDNPSGPPEALPEPPKVDKLPSTSRPEPTPPEPSQDETQAEELTRFFSTVMSSFGPVKTARLALKHPKNIEAAGNFAKGLGAAWAKFKNQ